MFKTGSGLICAIGSVIKHQDLGPVPRASVEKFPGGGGQLEDRKIAILTSIYYICIMYENPGGLGYCELNLVIMQRHSDKHTFFNSPQYSLSNHLWVQTL